MNLAELKRMAEESIKTCAEPGMECYTTSTEPILATALLAALECIEVCKHVSSYEAGSVDQQHALINFDAAIEKLGEKA
jgi:hypothetical protein